MNVGIIVSPVNVVDGGELRRRNDPIHVVRRVTVVENVIAYRRQNARHDHFAQFRARGKAVARGREFIAEENLLYLGADEKRVVGGAARRHVKAPV